MPFRRYIFSNIIAPPDLSGSFHAAPRNFAYFTGRQKCVGNSIIHPSQALFCCHASWALISRRCPIHAISVEIVRLRQFSPSRLAPSTCSPAHAVNFSFRLVDAGRHRPATLTANGYHRPRIPAPRDKLAAHTVLAPHRTEEIISMVPRRAAYAHPSRLFTHIHYGLAHDSALDIFGRRLFTAISIY